MEHLRSVHRSANLDQVVRFASSCVECSDHAYPPNAKAPEPDPGKGGDIREMAGDAWLKHARRSTY
jgi:hypothetical protein